MAGLTVTHTHKGAQSTAAGACIPKSLSRLPNAARRRKVDAKATAERTASSAASHSHPAPTRRGLLSTAVAAAAVMSAAQGTTNASPAQAASVFEGEYNDPNHPGCLRRIEADGRVVGADGTPGCLNGEPQKEWVLQGVIDDEKKRIFIDFSPKGGPKDLVGVWTDGGIKFPDGNLWSKK